MVRSLIEDRSDFSQELPEELEEAPSETSTQDTEPLEMKVEPRPQSATAAYLRSLSRQASLDAGEAERQQKPPKSAMKKANSTLSLATKEKEVEVVDKDKERVRKTSSVGGGGGGGGGTSNYLRWLNSGSGEGSLRAREENDNRSEVSASSYNLSRRGSATR